MAIRIRQIFHPVGHGTFHTGTAWSEKHGIFRWAYDCGSKREKHLGRIIECSARYSHWWRHDAAVDLLVISHFDNDHVNGVEQFLRTWRVKWLALPYIPLAQRLESASDHGGTSCSASTALFQLDPELWLVSRGLEGRVERILQVKGGPQEAPEDPEPRYPEAPLNEPDEGAEPEIDALEEELIQIWRHGVSELDTLTTQEDISINGSTKSAAHYTLNHHQAFKALDSNIEFIFYNSDEPNLCTRLESGELVAKRSGTNMSIVSDEIQKVVHKYNIGLTDAPPRPNWRKKLRYVYDHHFGKSSKKRNSISLCLYTRPIADEPMVFDTGARHFTNRYANLCLGDLTINPYTIKSLKSHLGEQRWETLSTVQVPHHGSRHSWHAGAADYFSAPYFVHCIPNTSPHHPHPEVIADLEPSEPKINACSERMTLNANYCLGVFSQIRMGDIYSAYTGNIILDVGPWHYLICE